MTQQKKIILIGPVTHVKSGLIGGATISFGHLVHSMEQAGIAYYLVNTQQFPQGISRIFNPVYVLLKTLRYLFFADVIFLNSSRGGTKYLAPMLFCLAKIRRLKFVFRPFGGDLRDYVGDFSPIYKWLFKNTTLKTDLLFLQTKVLMDHYKGQHSNIVPLPTSRENPSIDLLRGERAFEKRFVYLGFINEAKGIDHIIEAADRLGKDYTVHIYGPIKETIYHQKLTKLPDLYKGVLPKEKVLSTLRKYDVLILPTYYGGEGYPGVIIEAYSLGLPVIATDWKAIPELVKQNETGLLIKPKSTTALVDAIQYFDEKNYNQYSQNARNCFLTNFETDKIMDIVMAEINKL